MAKINLTYPSSACPAPTRARLAASVHYSMIHFNLIYKWFSSMTRQHPINESARISADAGVGRWLGRLTERSPTSKVWFVLSPNVKVDPRAAPNRLQAADTTAPNLQKQRAILNAQHLPPKMHKTILPLGLREQRRREFPQSAVWGKRECWAPRTFCLLQWREQDFSPILFSFLARMRHLYSSATTSGKPNRPSGARARVFFFFHSKCPYNTNALSPTEFYYTNTNDRQEKLTSYPIYDCHLYCIVCILPF